MGQEGFGLPSTKRRCMRSKSILLSIFLSAIILAVTAVNVHSSETKYYIPASVGYKALSKPTQKQIDCLTENIYFEAGHEPKDGQIAVALVTLNRVASGNYGSDVCEVVKQKTVINGNTICQFSWVCDTFFTSKRLTIIQTSLYNQIREVAVFVLMNYENMTDITKGATYYHADYVNPQWKLPKTTQIGRHIFYKRHSDLATMKKELKL